MQSSLILVFSLSILGKCLPLLSVYTESSGMHLPKIVKCRTGSITCRKQKAIFRNDDIYFNDFGKQKQILFRCIRNAIALVSSRL